MNYNSIKKNIREIGLMFLSAGLLLFLSCGSDDTKDVSSEDGDVNSNQYLQVQPNGLNVIKVSSSDVAQVVYPFSFHASNCAVRATLALPPFNSTEKGYTEFKKNGTEYVIALRLTSSVAKVRKSQSDFLYFSVCPTIKSSIHRNRH